MSLPVVILGNGGHARVVADICRVSGRTVRGFIDRGGAPPGEHVLGGDDLLDDRAFVDAHEFVIGIAHQRIRRRLAELVLAKGGTLTSVIHPSAVVAADVVVGRGVVLVAGCIVNPASVLGDLVIVNTGATVDHDSVLHKGVHVCPGAHLAGSVICGEYAFVGTGAIVVPNRTIGQRAIVGAGAIVIADVADDVTVVGAPARVVKNVGC